MVTIRLSSFNSSEFLRIENTLRLGIRGDAPFDERALQGYMHGRRKALINESSAMRLAESREKPPSVFFHDNFGGEMEFTQRFRQMEKADEIERDAYLDIFRDPARGDLLAGGLCDAILAFRETGGVKPHVLIAHINENWGAFSTAVPNRTVNWGSWEGNFRRDGCVAEDLWYYLNHTNVSAIFTTTHQWLDHPKIFSVPLGVKTRDTERVSKEIHERPTPNRTELLMINHQPRPERKYVLSRVTANFNWTIENTYKDGSDYWEHLRNSKFILCPSGLGWDTYRIWEALMMGAIPVVETYYRRDGFYKTLDGLPVLRVDHFDNVTRPLLEEAYPKILSRARGYNFEKLTNRWWADFINSYRPSRRTL